MEKNLKEEAFIRSGCYIRFSSKAELMRIDDGLCVELTYKEYKILSLFWNKVDKPVSLYELAECLWGINYDKNPDSIKSQITRLKAKIIKISPELVGRLNTNHGYGTYTFKSDINDKPLVSHENGTTDADEIETELERTGRKIDQLVDKLESLREKLENAKSENNAVWSRIYSAQFDTTFSLLESIYKSAIENQQIIRESYDRIEKNNVLCGINCSADIIACDPDTIAVISEQLQSINDWILSAEAEIKYTLMDLNSLE